MLLSLLAACTGGSTDSGTDGAESVTIPFRASVGGAPFACDTTYDGVGTTGVTIDLLDFYVDNNLDEPVDYVTDYVSGCMAFGGDPECEGLMPKLGLPWGDVQDPPAQTFFAVETL